MSFDPVNSRYSETVTDDRLYRQHLRELLAEDAPTLTAAPIFTMSTPPKQAHRVPSAQPPRRD